jgi:hypothetical protein
MSLAHLMNQSKDCELRSFMVGKDKKENGVTPYFSFFIFTAHKKIKRLKDDEP